MLFACRPANGAEQKDKLEIWETAVRRGGCYRLMSIYPCDVASQVQGQSRWRFRLVAN